MNDSDKETKQSVQTTHMVLRSLFGSSQPKVTRKYKQTVWIFKALSSPQEYQHLSGIWRNLDRDLRLNKSVK